MKFKSKILFKVPVIVLLVVNIYFGNFWLAGYYYCQKGLAIWGILSLFCLYAEKLFRWIRRIRAQKIAEKERLEAEELAYEEDLKNAWIAARAEAEALAEVKEREFQLQKREENEEFILLISKAVEKGVRDALNK